MLAKYGVHVLMDKLLIAHCGCTRLRNCGAAKLLWLTAVDAFEQIRCAPPEELTQAEHIFNAAKMDFVQHRRQAFKEIDNEQ